MRIVRPDGKPMTTEDFQALTTQLRSELAKNKNVAYLINQKEKAIQDGNYHCFASYHDQDHSSQTIMTVSLDRKLYNVSGSGTSRIASDPVNQDASGLLSRNLDDIVSQRLSPEKIKNLLNELRKFKNVQFQENVEHGKKYYVFTLKHEQMKEEYFFDAETYQLSKLVNEGSRNNGGIPETFKHSSTFFENNIINDNESSEIFNPVLYGMFPESRNQYSSWSPLPRMQDGCYDADDKPLTPAEKEKFLKSLPAEALKKFKEQQQAWIESAKRDEQS